MKSPPPCRRPWWLTRDKLVVYIRETTGFVILVATFLLKDHTSSKHQSMSVVRQVKYEPVWTVDLSLGDDSRILAPPGSLVPTEPLRGQKRPPCRPDAEHSINGGCWVGTDRVPPCPGGFYGYGAKCFMPVLAPQRLPTSMKE